ncbi:hypothetical protein PMAYCL1PPCAC_02720 [Pristionchus mayeri]|uniref:RNA polymerase II subunit B1 CTD phosphatase RPAP2 homolog n=1 Tax=Pristionchus mayeri TaxID=1317129 RepID=A0AAN5C6I1_9BILA|nr:hypothetical protein PMAYCL1PPCAC_02720 [Pristionchus mayeri]
MDERQWKMVAAAAEEILSRGKEKEMDEEAREKGLRKRVFEAIMALSDAVDEKTTLQHLPYLDRSSWKEVADERFLAQLCAFPSCEKKMEKAKGSQKYKIDRVEGKIYEKSQSHRLSFCSSECWDRFEAVKEDLPEEPLWITRTPKSSLVSASPVGPSPRRSTEREGVEIVKDTLLVSRLDNLFIAERDGTSTDDEKEEDEEGKKGENVEDKEFLSSIQRYCTVSGNGETKRNPEKIEVDEGKKDERSEDEKLKALKEKLKNRKVAPKRKAILTEAKPLTTAQLKEEERMAFLSKKEKPSPSTQESSNGMNGLTTEEMDTLPEETVPFTGDWETPVKNFVDWMNRRTTELVRMGGRRPVTEVDRLLKRFYAGDKAEAVENVDESVPLPMVDGFDVKKRRIEIMITSIKSTYLSMEAHLCVRSTRLEDLRSIVSTLSLDAHSVTGWSKKEMRVITLGLWRIVCMLSDELENDFFPLGNLSNEMRSLLEMWQLEESPYSRMIKVIEGRIEMFETTSH